ncbi:hypothetical protein GKODMF_06420 [Candidatus Electrothrix gigas]
MIVKGRGVKKRMLTAAIIVGISSLPNTATACGMCGFGILEYTLPHTMFWCLGITIWFCAVGIITAPKKFVTDLIAVFVIFFLGTAFFGPYPFWSAGTYSMYSDNQWLSTEYQKEDVGKIKA